ncbi:MAG: hypothetical protein HQL86_01350 [Magnetococcales bacterium]|nr:hypothetical protein [Magnetococcales bacterium]
MANFGPKEPDQQVQVQHQHKNGLYPGHRGIRRFGPDLRQTMLLLTLPEWAFDGYPHMILAA